MVSQFPTIVLLEMKEQNTISRRTTKKKPLKINGWHTFCFLFVSFFFLRIFFGSPGNWSAALMGKGEVDFKSWVNDTRYEGGTFSRILRIKDTNTNTQQ